VIGWEFMGPHDHWHLVHADGGSVDVEVTPRLVSDNLLVLREAALEGLGIAPMSTLLCAGDIAAGRLQVVAPGWSPPPATLYAIYASRGSLSTAGRVFIDDFASYLSAAYR
jgi:DNA-binding transcriptional LysR family regulator